MAQRESAAYLSGQRASIKQMTEHDLLEVVEIEQICGLSPWGWDAYHAELEQGSAALMLVAGADAKIPESGRRLAGYIVARLVADELHVNNAAVRPEFQRQGIGAALLKEVLIRAGARGAISAWLEVRAGNRPAQGLYERCGFSVTGRRRDYYKRPVEDALVMHATLIR